MTLSIEGLDAIRLIDFQAMDQETAAEIMNMLTAEAKAIKNELDSVNKRIEQLEPKPSAS